ncbi:MAG: acyl-CoA thioesterase [Aquimonas sp.]|nr:acyl-CoA thioesterase [Aquimonas sp.]
MSERDMKTVFEVEMDVRWGDMDAFNHVNNASYLRYIEEARVLWFKQISPDWADPDCAPILAAAQMNYRRPIGWPERLRIRMAAERVGGKSLTLSHRIESAAQPELLYADGNTVLVWVRRDGSSMALPDFVLRACEA